MKATDLRIGNYVYYNGTHKEIGVVTALESYLVLPEQSYVKLNHVINNKYYLTEINPIELTEELLLKCGFVRNGDWAELEIPTRAMIRFYNFNCAECDLVQDGKYFAFKNSHIIYLHQLQNLYFALTQTELQITL